MKKNLRIVALVSALALAFVFAGQHVQPVGAQVGGSYGRVGNTAVGNFVNVFTVADSDLYIGELVMADTQTVAAGGLLRIGVKRFDGTSLGRARVVGVLVDNVARSSRRGSGRCLVWGYTPKMYVGVSNAAANSLIKVGLVNAMFQTADTLTMTVGYVISRSSAATSTVNTGPRYLYKGYFWGNHGWGATL